MGPFAVISPMIPTPVEAMNFVAKFIAQIFDGMGI
jgi:hypothetical protein